MIRPKEIFCLSVILFFLCSGAGAMEACFAQTSASQMERALELLEKEKALRETIEKGQKVFIKKIIVKGATLLSEERIKEIILPFKNHWLTEADINSILDSITAAYKQKGYNNQPVKALYQVKKNLLKIQVVEGH